MITDAMRAVAITTTLHRMFQPTRWLDICDLDTVWGLAGVTVEPEVRNALRLLHCQHWNTLPAEVRTIAGQQVALTLGWEPSVLITAGAS